WLGLLEGAGRCCDAGARDAGARAGCTGRAGTGARGAAGAFRDTVARAALDGDRPMERAAVAGYRPDGEAHPAVCPRDAGLQRFPGFTGRDTDWSDAAVRVGIAAQLPL